MKDEFWKRLQGAALPDVFNPWGEIDAQDIEQLSANLHRVGNLTMHLAIEPRYILIGEAPGYRGCHFSGIPFTSEKQIFNHEVPYVARWGRITTRAELMGNADVLKMLLDEKNADGVRIVAVGNSADYTLRHLGIYPDRIVRHPSMGGARLFADQLARIVHENI